MEFPASYFEGEEREGFYVQPLMKRAWAAQIEILLVINEICKRHNIRYFAEWGTLLGAIRHKGYIPWDDDLDIGMMRKVYFIGQIEALREFYESNGNVLTWK